MTEPMETTAEELAHPNFGRAHDGAVGQGVPKLLRDFARQAAEIDRLLSARQSAAEEMRALAVAIAHRYTSLPVRADNRTSAEEIEAEIRALPLSPPGTDPTIAQGRVVSPSTVEELDRILNSESDEEVDIWPDGSVHPKGKPVPADVSGRATLMHATDAAAEELAMQLAENENTEIDDIKAALIFFRGLPAPAPASSAREKAIEALRLAPVPEGVGNDTVYYHWYRDDRADALAALLSE